MSNLSKSYRGQVSTEFALMLIMVVAIFVILFFIANGMNSTIGNLQAGDKSKLIAFDVAHAINTAFLGSNGFSINVTIPSNYTLVFQPRGITATDLSGRSGSAPVITSNISMSIPEGIIMIIVRNVNGTIVVSQ